MIPMYLSPLANHLWQSTLFAAVAVLLALAMRKNRAQMRYWLWLAASVKFLIPFSLLVSVGSRFEWRTAPAVAPQLSTAIEQISQPFAPAPLPVVVAPAAPGLLSMAPILLLGLWLCGCLVVVSIWWRDGGASGRLCARRRPCISARRSR